MNFRIKVQICIATKRSENIDAIHVPTYPMGRFTRTRVQHRRGSVHRRILRLHEPGLGEGWIDFHFPTSCAWARTLNHKTSDVQTSPGQMSQCLHEEIEEISTLLARSTRVSRRVTRQGGLTRLDYCFHVNTHKHLTAKGLPDAMIQLGQKSNPGSCKDALSPTHTLAFPRDLPANLRRPQLQC